MRVVQVPNGTFLANTWIVVDEAAGECAVVDPGEDAGLVLHKVADTGARVAAIWLTHAHLDHVMGVGRIRAETGAPVFLHAADRPLYDAVPQQAAAFGVPADAPPAPDRAWAHGDVARVGGLEFAVRHVPGHSPGHVALVGHGVVFGGDTLFAGSIGRADLPGGDLATLIESIRRELLSLPDDTIVHSGHGPDTTIGAERRVNPFLTGATGAFRFS
jgi:glyoxylase-like metal-dependent hydrolase (beta-lactamase superfamily II)